MDHINSVVLESALAILCGGIDKQGNCLVIFPPDCADLIDVYSTGDILELLKLYVTIADRAVSIVADMKHGWTEECIIKFTRLLDGLQAWKKDCLHTAYLIKPCVRTKKRMLHRQLSRLHTYGRTVTAYKVVRMETLEEIYEHIDKNQLTHEYGGSLRYDHRAWIQFQKKYLTVIKKTAKLVSIFPTMKKDMETFRENVARKSQYIQNDNESVMTTQYNTVLQKYSVHEAIKTCEGALAVLGHPEDHPELVNVHPAVMENTGTRLLKLHREIRQEIECLEKIVFKEKHEQQRQKKLDTCRDNSKEVVETIVLLSQQITELPLIGNDAIQAQTYRNAFIADVLQPSKDIVDCASSILQNLNTDKDTTPASYKASFEIARQLTEALQPFTSHINKLNETYTRIHMFYVIYNKVVRWKEKASKFIDLHLVPLLESALSDRDDNNTDVSSTNTTHGSISNIDSHLYSNQCTPKALLKEIKIKAPGAWDILMDHFRYKHPPPKRKHLKLITKNVSDFINKPQLIDAETLAERTMFILAFFSRKCFKGEDIVLILKWRRYSNDDTDCCDSSDVIVDMDDSDLEVTSV